MAVPRSSGCTATTTHSSTAVCFEYIRKYKCWAHARCVIMYRSLIHKLIGHWINIDIGCNLHVSLFLFFNKRHAVWHTSTAGAVYERSNTNHGVLYTHLGYLFFCFWCYGNHTTPFQSLLWSSAHPHRLSGVQVHGSQVQPSQLHSMLSQAILVFLLFTF